MTKPAFNYKPTDVREKRWASSWAMKLDKAQKEIDRLKGMNVQMLTALEWAVPILQVLLADHEIADAMVELNMTAEPNLSEALAAIKAARGPLTKDVIVTRDHGDEIEILAKFATIKEAENFIALRELVDPAGVEAGIYGVDAPEWKTGDLA